MIIFASKLIKMEKKDMLKYGDKIYVCRCKKKSETNAICIIEEVTLNKHSLTNIWKGKKLSQDVYVYGYGRSFANVISNTGLISRCFYNGINSFSMFSNNKNHLKNRIKIEMSKKGVKSCFVKFVDF